MLLEHQGKALLREAGIPVPAGALWPALPDIAGELVLKAQVPVGGRGKAGGIRFAASPGEARQLAPAMLRMEISGHPVETLLVEERLAPLRELYLAVAIDRDARAPVVLASPDGGVEIESVAAERLLGLPVDPAWGLRPFQVQRVQRFLGLEGAAAEALGTLLQALYRLRQERDALLVEINPLVLLADGRLVAADAKILLDANAAYRQPALAQAGAYDPPGSAVERALAKTGATGIEIDPAGGVVGVVSGAGLMMATLDLFADAGVSPRLMVDLGGTVLRGAEGLAPVFAALQPLQSEVIFVNAYLQTALCDELARALIEAMRRSPLGGRLVLRLKGRNAAEARSLLAPLGVTLHEELSAAIAAVAEAAAPALATGTGR